VLQNSDERLGNRLVLIVLADHAHNDGSNCFPSVKTIAEEARMSERNVRYALRELEEHGSIRSTGRTSKGMKVYEIVGVQILQGLQKAAEQGADFAPEPSFNHQEPRVQILQCPQCGPLPKVKTQKHLTEHLENVHGIRAA